jgi:atrazine chlorohydrolase/5-methylthioadenosine/S-adenosylhomocysteine deaminase/melamine deaminase
MADLVIDNATILTMDPERRIIPNGYLAITGNRIERIGSGRPEGPPAKERIDGRGGLVAPGFISAHQHIGDALVRGGLEQDRNLFDWFLNIYYGALSAYTTEDCKIAARLNLAEAIRAGVTTINDNWGINTGDELQRVDDCAEASLEVYREVGIRIILARMFVDDMPPYWGPLLDNLFRKVPGIKLDRRTIAEDTDRVLSSIEGLMAKHHGTANGRIRTAPSPMLPQCATPEALRGSLELARRFDTVVPIHVCESNMDARVFNETWGGLSCTDYLNNLGFLDCRVLAAHCVWLNDRDIRLLKVNDVKVAHNPSTNMFLASGIAHIPRMIMGGITVGLGIDDTSTGCNVDMLREMRHAALLQKVANLDAGAMTSEKVLEMATIDGARAIGLEKDIGSLEAGKKADLILFDTDKPHWYPRHHLASVIVYQAHPDDVRTVIIDGNVVMRDRILSWLDPDAERRLGETAQRASEAMIERAGLQFLKQRGWQSLGRW